MAWERSYSTIPSELDSNDQEQTYIGILHAVARRAIPRFYLWAGEYSNGKSMKPCYRSGWYRTLSCGAPAGSQTAAQVSASQGRCCGPFLATRQPSNAIARIGGHSLYWAGAFRSVS